MAAFLCAEIVVAVQPRSHAAMSVGSAVAGESPEAGLRHPVSSSARRNFAGFYQGLAPGTTGKACPQGLNGWSVLAVLASTSTVRPDTLNFCSCIAFWVQKRPQQEGRFLKRPFLGLASQENCLWFRLVTPREISLNQYPGSTARRPCS